MSYRHFLSFSNGINTKHGNADYSWQPHGPGNPKFLGTQTNWIIYRVKIKGAVPKTFFVSYTGMIGHHELSHTPGDTPYNGPYRDARPFLGLQLYERVGISLVELYEGAI